MSAPARSVDEIVAALTARLASAREIKVHAERLMAIAEAQDGLARQEAVAAFGDAGGLGLYQAVSAVHGLSAETRSRVCDVPGLLCELTAPWEGPGTTARSPEAVPGPAPAPQGLVIHGVPVEAADEAAARRLVDEARGYARTGDEDAMARRAAKLVGRHRWRRDLLESAYRDALAAGAGTEGSPMPAACPPDGDSLIPIPDLDEPEDMVFGDGPPPPSTDAVPPRPPLRPVGESLIDPGAGWSGVRPQRPRPNVQNASGHPLPGLFAARENG